MDIEIGKKAWDNTSNRVYILSALREGLGPYDIRAEFEARVNSLYSHLPKQKRKKMVENVYLAAQYAFDENIHLD